jgi:hypothetical protein
MFHDVPRCSHLFLIVYYLLDGWQPKKLHAIILQLCNSQRLAFTARTRQLLNEIFSQFSNGNIHIVKFAAIITGNINSVVSFPVSWWVRGWAHYISSLFSVEYLIVHLAFIFYEMRVSISCFYTFVSGKPLSSLDSFGVIHH